MRNQRETIATIERLQQTKMDVNRIVTLHQDPIPMSESHIQILLDAQLSRGDEHFTTAHTNKTMSPSKDCQYSSGLNAVRIEMDKNNRQPSKSIHRVINDFGVALAFRIACRRSVSRQ